MRRLLFTAAVVLLACNASLAQVSTMGTTAMGISSTPGTIVTSPPVPLASDPTTPGTVVTCSTPTGQIAPATPAVPVASMSAMVGTSGTMPPVSAAPTTSAVSPRYSTSTSGNATAPYLTLSAQPATSFMTDFAVSN